MIGRDASGSLSLRHGTMRDHVEGLRVVFANGETAALGREPWPAYDDEPADFKGVVVRKLGVLARRHPDLLTKTAPPSEHRAGYPFGRVASASGIDLARLLAGSEGTLALVTQARSGRSRSRRRKESSSCRSHGSSTRPRRSRPVWPKARPRATCTTGARSAWRDADPAFREWIAESAEAALLIAFEAESPDEVARRVRGLSAKLARGGRLAAEPVEVHKRADCDRLMGLRRAIEPLLMRMKGRRRPVPLLEGMAVPPAALPDFLQRLQNILKHHDVSWTLDMPRGPRSIPRPAVPRPVRPRGSRPARTAGDAIVGSGPRGRRRMADGEYGCGLVRTQFLRRQVGDLSEVFRAIKDAFDPLNLLNPGKVIGDDPHLMSANLTPMLPAPVEAVAPDRRADSIPRGRPPVLRWPDRGPVETAALCNGCGNLPVVGAVLSGCARRSGRSAARPRRRGRRPT